MTPVGFEPEIPASERPQTHALERAATGIGQLITLGWSNQGGGVECGMHKKRNAYRAFDGKTRRKK
jgi:hypothetical protein